MKISKITEKMVWAGLVAVALGVYLVTLSRGAYPGQSASLIASHMELAPRFAPSSPLWTGLVTITRAVSGEHFVQALNVISALCGALSVGLVYVLVREAVVIFIDKFGPAETKRRTAAMLAGTAAAFCLMFSIPFWMVSNRAHTAAFDVLLLLLAARLLLAYMDYGKLWIALIFSFLFGLGIVEFATFIVVAPLFGIWLLYVMWKRSVLRTGSVLALVAAAAVGLCAYLLAAWSFYETPGYELRKYQSFFHIVWFMWRDQYFLITRSLPREGWLIILFMTVAPWLAVLSIARRGLNDERDWGLYILHVVMTGIAVAVVLNAPLAPFAILGSRRLLVTPYVLVAMVYGYLVAYWFLLPRGWGQDPEAALTRFYRAVLGWILVVPLVGLLLWVPLRNYEFTHTRDAELVQVLADEMVESLDGREWLITNGILDHHLLLAANRDGIPLKLINLSGGRSSVYRDYLALQFEETRLQNLVKVGIPALLNAWFRTDPGVQEKIAVMTSPEILVRYGFEAVPNRLLFLPSKQVSELNSEALVAKHKEFWSRFVPLLRRAEGEGESELSPWHRWGKRHAGLVANNLGVLLEDLGRDAAAAEAYKAARDIDPDNISALLNWFALVEQGRAADPDGSVKAAFERFETTMDQKYHIWSLSRHYGYVRMPEAFAQLGWNWAYSGQEGMAITELEKAAALLPENKKSGVQRLMAGIFMRENRPEKSEALYREMLARDKKNQSALLGMMRIRLAQERFDDAGTFLALAAKAGVPEKQVILQRATIAFASGDLEEAQDIADEMLQKHREFLKGWVLLADIAFAAQDELTVDKCLRRLVRIEGDRGYFGSIIRGRRALQMRDVEAAVEHFEAALVRNPNNRRLAELLLRLQLTMGDRIAVRRHVKMLLQGDPTHSLALYVRGSLQIADEELVLAEDSLRHSLRGTRMPMALNDLAWLLQRRGEYEEALALINEALEKADKAYSFLDTQGVILMGMERYEDAVEAFGRALAIFDKVPAVHLHMAEAQLALGRREAARQAIETIAPMKEGLTPEDRELFNKLQAVMTKPVEGKP